MLACVTVIANVSYELPDVFDANPYGGAVNGFLWNMPT